MYVTLDCPTTKSNWSVQLLTRHQFINIFLATRPPYELGTR